MSGLEIRAGWVAADLAAEFPQLALHVIELGCGSGRTPPEVRERLRAMSDRYTGGKAINLRQEPIPWAYRVFFRQVGLDPDEHRTPAEELALRRMEHGSFRSRNLLDDAMTIATVETGVALVAFDSARVDRELGLRLAASGERLGGDGRELSTRQLVVADPDRAVAVLFGDMAEGYGVTPATTAMRLCAIQVRGVPAISIEEALWTAYEIVTG